jgi:hypothetical protein
MTRTPAAILVRNWEEGANGEREKRVTPEFGERKEEKILPPNSGRYNRVARWSLGRAIGLAGLLSRDLVGHSASQGCSIETWSAAPPHRVAW